LSADIPIAPRLTLRLHHYLRQTLVSPFRFTPDPHRGAGITP
jgi:hypothetical protein